MGCPNCKPKKPLPPPIPLRYSQMHLDCKTDSDEEVGYAKPKAAQRKAASKAATFKSRYVLGAVVGTGTFAVVYNCVNKATKETFAVKIVDKSKLDEETEEIFRKEVEMLGRLDSPHIIRCHEFFEDESTFYLVEEFADGGELFDRIAAQTVYNEKDAQELVKTLLQAVQYCHSLHVVHRDLKPENILMQSDATKSTEVMKLADFGFATVAPKDNLTRGCGTLDYVAPEILLHKSYGKPVDLWSVGVIAYILLSGHAPFLGETDEEEMENIKTVNYEFDYLSWRYVSEDAKDFIRKLLVLDPTERYNVAAALEDPWIKSPDLSAMHRSLHGASLNQSMHSSVHGLSAPLLNFDLNKSLHGAMGVLARSMHGAKYMK